MDVHDPDFDELDELFDELTVDQLRHIDEIEALATSVPILPTALEVTPGTQIVRDTSTLDTSTSAEGSSSTALRHVSRLEKRTFEQLDTDNMLSASDSDASRTVKRPRGRPPGTKNSESRTSTSSKLPKRPVGRPKKQPQHLFASVPAKFKLHGLRVPSEAPARIAAARSLSDALRMPSSQPAATRTQAPALLDDGLNGLQAATSTLSGKHLPLSLLNSTATPPPPAPGDLFPAETQIIPDNDPSRLCSLPDDDDDDDDDSNPEAGFVDDGLGEEEDIDEGDEEASASDKGKKPHNRRLPPWLQGEFEHHLAESSKRASDGLPALYRDHRTFWFPRPATFFRLQEKSISPQILYDYQFFLWDPLPLVSGGIICPNKGCTERLWRHDHVRYPRRVVDLHSTFWIIGYRYRCPRCRHPEQVKFRSWDTRILAALPSALSAEFPAILTHRSGLSVRTFNVMRSCFHNGVGTKQFSDTIRLQHLQNYDSLHLAYLQTIATRSSLPTYVTGERYKPFLPYDDRSEDGAHGFVPGAPWLRDLFDIFIEKHEHEFNQHTAMLSGSICAVDHSFKLTKHVAKVNGMQVFIALLTVTNEKGEIRICNLVATKAHSQFEVALHKMRESLTLYGHDQPSIFYTDSMADKDFLERCFPSLRADTVPVEKYGHLPTLNIPDEVQIIPCKNRTSIDNAMRTIIDSLPSNFDDSPLSSVVIGLDSEWNVEISDRGYITGRGQTAILQIAFDRSVFILQIGTMLTGGYLPDLLLQVLSNPRIIKVGRCVSADLRYLQQCCHRSKAKFTGAVDLGKYAKDRLLVPTARVSLSDLCAKVLSKSLNKNVSERTSTFWEEETLTAQQLHYAALDAYASLLLYEHLSKAAIPTPLIGPLIAGDPVLLYTSDRTRCAAEGTISPHASDVKYSGINITPTRTVIVITKVHIPAAFVLNGTSDKQQLASFGAVPFHVVCLRNHLRQFTNQVHHPKAPAEPTQSLSATESVSEAAFTTVIPEISTADNDDDDGDNFTNPVTRIGTMLLESLRSGVLPSSSQLPADNTVDPDSEAEGRQVIEECNSNASKWSSVIRSRVLKDPFHVLDMFYISVSHGLLHDFLLTLRDTIFIPDKVDKARIIVWGSTQQPPVAWEELVARRAKWVWRRCKRIIPPPEELYPLVAAVFEKYGPLKDAKTHLPLFNSAAWAVAKNILELVQKGFISDPPGIPLYYQLGIDTKTGLPLYRCMRGTNMTEGGVHTHLRSRLPTSGVSVRHVQSRLLDFILRHNLLVGTYNSTGTRYKGHYSIWITNQLQEMLYLVHDFLLTPKLMVGWVNGNLYKPTSEVSGVLPIPDSLRVKAGMGMYIHTEHSRQLHHFLASRQGTRQPVLPINNDAERTLFRELMARSSGLNFNGPDWDDIVVVWNSKAEIVKEISYKLPEQLKAYYNGDWKKFTNIKQTKAMTATERHLVKTAIHSPQRFNAAPLAPTTERQLHSVTTGFAIPDDSTLTPSASLHCSNADTGDQPLPQDPPLPTISPELITAHLSVTKAQQSVPILPAEKMRKARTCRKCALDSCKGKGKVVYCQNPCQDCGEVECLGRNPTHLAKPCARTLAKGRT